MSRMKSAETRARLLDAAARLLVERGYHQVGMEGIARAAGVSRQAVYQGHFASKAELVVALARRFDEAPAVVAQIRRFEHVTSSIDALDLSVEVVASIEREIHDIARVFEAARLEDPAFQEAWQDRMAQRRRGAAIVVDWLERDGRLADGWTTDEAVDFLWTLNSVWFYQALVVERGWTWERYVERLQGVARAALLRPV
jgi:AcrR family transcriptional regulator